MNSSWKISLFIEILVFINLMWETEFVFFSITNLNIGRSAWSKLKIDSSFSTPVEQRFGDFQWNLRFLIRLNVKVEYQIEE